jgi:hypothetical protein
LWKKSALKHGVEPDMDRNIVANQSWFWVLGHVCAENYEFSHKPIAMVRPDIFSQKDCCAAIG